MTDLGENLLADCTGSWSRLAGLLYMEFVLMTLGVLIGT